MSYEQIRLEIDGPIATLTMHRPDKMNAFTGQMMQEMIDAFDQTDANDDVRAVIVTGEGERAFCAGADLSSGGNTFAKDNRSKVVRDDGTLDYASEDARDGGGRLTLRMFDSKKPIIAAINGVAVGIGSTMLLPMDIRIASDTARFGFVFTRRGIVPEAASSYFLPRVVGINQALEWCYSGRVFDAEEAKNGGLISEIVPQDKLLETARAKAMEIAENTAPVSVSLTRAMLWRGLGMDHPMEAHKLDSRGILNRGRSEDAQEGVTSFLEKRPAVYPNKVSTDMPDFYPWWEDRPYE